jgi:choline dehydrogenase-like flavoprotein
VKDNYLYQAGVGSQGSVMAYRDNYLDLDPTYKDVHGQPLLRMTFDWKANDLAMTQFIGTKVEQIAKAMGPKQMKMSFQKPGATTTCASTSRPTTPAAHPWAPTRRPAPSTASCRCGTCPTCS